MTSSTDHRITPELVRWGQAKADAYVRLYGDTDGAFHPEVNLAIVHVSRETLREHDDFTIRAKVMVVRRLNRVLRRKRTAPLHLPMVDDGRWITGSAPPVGWEIESQENIESIATRVGGIHGELLRRMFLRAEFVAPVERGPSYVLAGKSLGLDPVRARNVYRWAIEQAQRIMLPIPLEAWRLLEAST